MLSIGSLRKGLGQNSVLGMKATSSMPNSTHFHFLPYSYPSKSELSYGESRQMAEAGVWRNVILFQKEDRLWPLLRYWIAYNQHLRPYFHSFPKLDLMLSF